MSNDLTLKTTLTADGSQLAGVLNAAGKQVTDFGNAGNKAATGLDAAQQASSGMEEAVRKAMQAVTALTDHLTQATAASQAYGTQVTVQRTETERLAQVEAKRAQGLSQALAAGAQARAKMAADRAAEIAAQQLESLQGEHFITVLQAEYDAIGKTRAELLQMKAAQLGVSDAAAPLIAGVTATNAGYTTLTTSTARLAQQHQIAAVQVKDFLEQVISGGSPVRAFAQQGAAVVSTYGGVGNTLKALSGIFTAARIGALGLAAGVAAIVTAYYQGRSELEQFNKTVILSGNVAGVTGQQLAEMSRQAAAASGSTQSKTAEVLNQIAASSGIGVQNMVKYTAAAVAFEKAGGDAAQTTVDNFKELAKAPLDATLKLNEATGYLTLSVYEQIRAYVQQGQTVKAAQVAQDAYANSLTQRTPQLVQNLGYLEKAWKGITDGAKWAWDAMLGLGREDTLDDKIRQAQANVDRMQRQKGGPGGLIGRTQLPTDDTALNAEKERLRILMLNRDQDAAIAASKAQQVKLSKDVATWDQAGVQYATWQKQLQLEINQIQEQGTRAGASQADINKRIAAARQRFDPGADQAGPTSRLAAVQRDLQQMAQAYQDADSIIAAQHQAGLLDDKAYYEAKGALIKANTDLQVSDLQAQNAYLQAISKSERLTTAERQANADKIKDNAAKIKEVEASAAAQTVVLGIQQRSAVDGIAKAYLQARQAAQDYLDTLTRSQERTLDLFSAGPQATGNAQARDQIADRYAAERTRIRNEQALLQTQQGGTLSASQEAQFQQQLRLQDEYESKALTSYDDFVKRRTALEADWSTGAAKAWNEYLETTRNVAQQTHDLLKNALDGGTDALANFLAAGKYTFNEFGRVVGQVTQQVLADLLKVYIRQQIVGLVGSYFGGTGSSGQYSLSGSGAQFGDTGGGGFWGPVKFHSGGVVGVDAGQPTAMSAAAWASARRYHTGLASDEYRAVLQRGESVLTPAQMRQLAPAGSSPVVNVQIPSINLINNTGTDMKASTSKRSDGGIDVLLEMVEQSIAGNVAAGAGSLGPALQGRYGLKPALAV